MGFLREGAQWLEEAGSFQPAHREAGICPVVMLHRSLRLWGSLGKTEAGPEGVAVTPPSVFAGEKAGFLGLHVEVWLVTVFCAPWDWLGRFMPPRCWRSTLLSQTSVVWGLEWLFHPIAISPSLLE